MKRMDREMQCAVDELLKGIVPDLFVPKISCVKMDRMSH